MPLPSNDLAPCLPPSWARSGHLQTVLGHLLPSPIRPVSGKSEDLALPDGDRLRLEWILGQESASPRQIVYLFHGLGGSTQAPYMRRTAEVARQLGMTVCLANHRGCGPGEGLAARPYHSGRAEDLSEVIRLGRERFPRAIHTAIGFSLSGNALLLLLSGRRGDTLPDSAIVVNAPIHLESAAIRLKKGLNRIYDLRFLRDCKRAILSRQRAGLIERQKRFPIRPWHSLHDFDQIYTAPEGGFESREHYYSSCSTRDLLSGIRVPTVLIMAKDDPFVDYRDYIEARYSASLRLELQAYGGHMGYLSRQATPLGSNRWLDYAIHHYLLTACRSGV
jgi:uncharacterized protein